MKDISSAIYETLTPQQRISATLDAMAREDEDECKRLTMTCPRKTYDQPDAEYTDGMDHILLAHMSAECDIRQQIIYFLTSMIVGSDKAENFLKNVEMMRKGWDEFFRKKGISPDTMRKITNLQGLNLEPLDQAISELYSQHDAPNR